MRGLVVPPLPTARTKKEFGRVTVSAHFPPVWLLCEPLTCALKENFPSKGVILKAASARHWQTYMGHHWGAWCGVVLSGWKKKKEVSPPSCDLASYLRCSVNTAMLSRFKGGDTACRSRWRKKPTFARWNLKWMKAPIRTFDLFKKNKKTARQPKYNFTNMLAEEGKRPPSCQFQSLNCFSSVFLRVFRPRLEDRHSFKNKERRNKNKKSVWILNSEE